MLRLFLAVCLFAVATAAAALQSRDFDAFVVEFGKTYPTAVEYEARRATFLANAAAIDRLNAAGGAVVYAMNAFGDMTPDEFSRVVLMRKRPSPRMPAARYAAAIPTQGIPDAFDWRNHSTVTPGSVGTCWAFSTVGAVESQRAIAGRGVEWLSVEQVVDCDNTTDPANLHSDCGVFGGWPYLAYQYITAAGGLASETAYDYCSGSGKCYPCPAPGWNSTRCGPPVDYCLKNESCHARFHPADIVAGSQVHSWVAVPADEAQMQAQLAARGPLSVLIDATGLQFYRSGIWAPKFCSKQDTDHVGYGESSGTPYWIIKNSWGAKWGGYRARHVCTGTLTVPGEQGYFQMQLGHNMCAINTGATIPVLG